MKCFVLDTAFFVLQIIFIILILFTDLKSCFSLMFVELMFHSRSTHLLLILACNVKKEVDEYGCSFFFVSTWNVISVFFYEFYLKLWGFGINSASGLKTSGEMVIHSVLITVYSFMIFVFRILYASRPLHYVPLMLNWAHVGQMWWPQNFFRSLQDDPWINSGQLLAKIRSGWCVQRIYQQHTRLHEGKGYKLVEWQIHFMITWFLTIKHMRTCWKVPSPLSKIWTNDYTSIIIIIFF